MTRTHLQDKDCYGDNFYDFDDDNETTDAHDHG
ncbi:hypothetical protein PC123_g23002 [Phytophthora cactorum]|nr:hypothetical protein PC120_g21272 [Phytophthora cactorum]KAG4041484.1 hypothetical protein PC123_g23002 [Phytophthora cactorum]